MKKWNWNSRVHALAMCAFLLVGTSWMTGCSVLGWQTSEVKKVKLATMTLEELEDAWGDFVVAGKATDAQKDWVRTAHDRVREARECVRKAALAVSIESTPEAEDELRISSEAYRRAADDFTVLVAEYLNLR